MRICEGREVRRWSWHHRGSHRAAAHGRVFHASPLHHECEKAGSLETGPCPRVCHRMWHWLLHRTWTKGQTSGVSRVECKTVSRGALARARLWIHPRPTQNGVGLWVADVRCAWRTRSHRSQPLRARENFDTDAPQAKEHHSPRVPLFCVTLSLFHALSLYHISQINMQHKCEKTRAPSTCTFTSVC